MTAGIVDVCFLVLTSAFFIGVILGTALVAQKCQALMDATKASLEERGWIVHGAHHHPSSSKGEGAGAGTGAGGKDAKGNVVVVKTGKKVMDQEHYLDATQRGVMKAWNASTFGSPSSQTQSTTTAGHGPGPSSFGGVGAAIGGGLSSTFTHFRSQLLLPPLAPAPAPAPAPATATATAPPSAPQPGQQLRVESAANGGQGQGAASGSSSGGGGGGGGGGRVAGDGDPGRGAAVAGARDSLYDMADRLSAWPSEKVEKVKRLRDQFLSKV